MDWNFNGNWKFRILIQGYTKGISQISKMQNRMYCFWMNQTKMFPHCILIKHFLLTPHPKHRLIILTLSFENSAFFNGQSWQLWRLPLVWCMMENSIKCQTQPFFNFSISSICSELTDSCFVENGFVSAAHRFCFEKNLDSLNPDS